MTTIKKICIICIISIIIVIRWLPSEAVGGFYGICRVQIPAWVAHLLLWFPLGFPQTRNRAPPTSTVFFCVCTLTREEPSCAVLGRRDMAPSEG